MPRYLLVKPAKGMSIPNPHTDARRYLGKPNATTPLWSPGEEPIAEVVLADPALHKAARAKDKAQFPDHVPDLAILGTAVADNLEAARAALQSQPTSRAPKPGKE